MPSHFADPEIRRRLDPAMAMRRAGLDGLLSRAGLAAVANRCRI